MKDDSIKDDSIKTYVSKNVVEPLNNQYLSDEKWYGMFDEYIDKIQPILDIDDFFVIKELRKNYNRISIVSMFVDIWLKMPETIFSFEDEPDKKQAMNFMLELIDE